MSYVSRTLGTGETIEYEVEFHWLWTFSAYFFLVLFGGTGIIGSFLLYTEEQTQNAIEVIMSVGAVGLAVGLIIFLYMMIKKWTTERVLTNLRFIQKKGWIIRKTEEIRIDRMEEVNLNQSILGRIFDYGDVRISGMGVGHIFLKMIDDPLGYQKKLNDLKATFAIASP
tara:strand:- start:7209 stop:7715 length:507 start_codon:yes stop_codon:yes gene_type:complete